MLNKTGFIVLISLASAAQSATFPSDYICDNGEDIHIEMKGLEQRLIYKSAKFGQLNGYLDVYRGFESNAGQETIAEIHGVGRFNDQPLAFNLNISVIGNQAEPNSITYYYAYYRGNEAVAEKGECLKVKGSGYIEGSKNYFSE